MTLSSILTWNLVFIGVVRGLIIALIAMGLVLVYRSSRVINFAVGDLGVPSAALLALMAGTHEWPYWPALVAALLIGTLAGTVVELAVIRRLFRAPPVIVFMATIGVAQLFQAVTHTIPDYRTGRLQTRYPSPLTSEWHPGLGITVRGPQLLVLVVVPALTIALWWLLGHTAFGESVRASFSNPDLARLTGINPKWMSTAVWTIGGFLSATAVILIATETTSTDLVSIGPNTLLRGLAAALVGRMVSFPRAVVAAVAIGVLDQILLFNFTSETGLVQFMLFLMVLLLVSRASRERDGAIETFQFAPRVRAIPERVRNVWWIRRLPAAVIGFALTGAVVLPLLFTESAKHFTYTRVLGFALCAVSVTILTGWAGQLSLGQMAFGGMGALTAAAAIRGVTVDAGIGSFLRLQGTSPTLPFPAALLFGAVVAALCATGVGLGALRVRGLLLAASTLGFAIAAQSYIFRRPILSLGQSSVHLPRSPVGPFDITDKNRTYYYAVLAVLVVALVMLGRLRRSGIGRMTIGVRDNETGAAALTVSPTRTKLTAFALSGFTAGLGGALLGALVVTIGFSANLFTVNDSIAVVAMAVIGGLGTLTGAVVGAVWVVGLPAFWPKNDVVPLFTSSIGLLLILLYLPGGLTQIGYWIREQLVSIAERRAGPPPAKAATAPPASLARPAAATPAVLNADGSVLRTLDLTVRFGGLIAVDSVSVVAQPGEVVGLIGANGAGKSTLLNAIGGFVPCRGTVELLGERLDGRQAFERARRGLGRTFQAATLFPELTVREVVELSLEARHRTSFWSTALFLPSGFRLERQRRTDAAELIDFLGLGRFADQFVAELSTGTRRIVELATVLAVGPRVICLDEPAAGVAQREAEAFGPLILRVQAELGATLLIVEHDLPLILSISDRVYCLEAGRVIAEGSPAGIRTDPKVVASYLGTDERAVLRSGQVS